MRSIRFLVLLLTLGTVSVTGQSSPAIRPNIVFILADDLGIDWLSCYGSDNATPNLDRLAHRGTRFEIVWTAPICTPSRVMMLTGRYPGRTGWTEHYDVPRWGGAGLEPDHFNTWPQRLRTAGYATALVGKWQLNDLRLDPRILARHGFQFHCVWPGVESDNPPSTERYWNGYLQTDGRRQIHRGVYGPDVTQNYALNFMRQHRDEPFLLFYSAIAVHNPHVPTPLTRDMPPTSERELYRDAVAYLDGQIGELVDEIDRLGLTDRTVIIFAGDNGSSVPGVMHGRTVPVGKGLTTDFGVHVPFIACLPGATTRPAITDELVDFTSIFPTVCELAGLATDSTEVDGPSLVPLLQGEPSYVPRSWIYAQRDLRRTTRDRRYKLNDNGEMFDLLKDPDERLPLDWTASEATRTAHHQLAAGMAAVPAAGAPPFPGYSPEPMRAVERRIKAKATP